MTYKIDHYEEAKWLYSTEHEISVSCSETARAIVCGLGLEPLVVIDNTKHKFIIGNFEIVVEDVKDLGYFLEIEIIEPDEKLSEKANKETIFEFLKGSGIEVSEEINAGKPELMLKKKLQDNKQNFVPQKIFKSIGTQTDL